jgi:hypothetical protein
MKRGLITWDKEEIPPKVFERRLEKVRRVLDEQRLPALAVYSDLWRSNQARFFSNFSPYFNRALLIIPVDQPPVLLCGLSPRVYGWIRSVTIIEDVRPAPNFAKALLQLAGERNWTRLGMLDFDQFPYDMYKSLHTGSLEVVDIASDLVYAPGDDDVERAMRVKAAEMAREILEKELPKGVGSIDHHFVGRLERQFRRLGAEDLIVLLSNGHTVPGPPAGARLEENYSVSIALEYRGHWIRMTRPQGSDQLLDECRNSVKKPSLTESLAGSYPYECGQGSIVGLHTELSANGKRIFYGGTIL